MYKTGYHRFGIEKVRWFNIDRSECICRLCDSGYFEHEEHVFVACPRCEEIRLAHNIDVEDFYSLL